MHTFYFEHKNHKAGMTILACVCCRQLNLWFFQTCSNFHNVQHCDWRLHGGKVGVRRPDITAEVKVEQSEQLLQSICVYTCTVCVCGCVCFPGLISVIPYLPSHCNFLFVMIPILPKDSTCYWIVRISFDNIWCHYIFLIM